MNIKAAGNKILISLAILLVSFNPYGNRVQSPHAQISTGDLRRDDMMQIAQRYVSDSWNAAPYNIIHGLQTIGSQSWQVDTPDASVSGGWWDLGPNTSIPYQWGGWSALDDDDLNLTPDDDGLYFDAQLELGYAAGDKYTSKNSGYPLGAGVDCSGFISRVWRTQTKYGTGNRANQSGIYEISRPIKFEDLRPGDILLTNGHVVLFQEFLTPEKSSPNTTRILVIEASSNDWRVSEREYTLTAISTQTESWGGKTYDTNQVTLRSGSIVYSGYWPRTYLTPIDVVLVVDRSGSMSDENKMVAAKNAAKMFVDKLRTKDKIGVVDFSTSATTAFQLTEIDADGTVKQAAKAAIDRLYALGSTSIGGGLQAAHTQLETRGVTDDVSDPVKVIVLLSDGRQNVSPYVDDVLPAIIQDKITVNTIGLGSDADQQLLSRIASLTKGVYKFAPSGVELAEIYNSILVRVYGGNVVRTGNGIVTSGGVAEQSVLVDSSIGTATFSVFWPGSDLDLTLIQPDGTLIDPAVASSSENVEFVSGPTYEFYQVEAPQHGEWKLRIFGVSTGPQGEQYSFSISALDAMKFSVTSDKTEYQPNDSIKIVASIEDSFLDVTYPQYIVGATMEVVVQDPGSNSFVFNLYDDGQHGDGAANDGIYANVFLNTILEGSYNFEITAAGVNNRASNPFSRETSLSIVVQSRFNQAPADFNKTNPTNGALNQPVNATLSWEASNGATSYEYCYDTTNDNACNSWVDAGNDTSVTISGLVDSITYYWHVRAINSNGTTYSNGSSNAFWSFTTMANLNSILYMTENQGTLRRVNQATGATTIVGNLGTNSIDGLSNRPGDTIYMYGVELPTVTNGIGPSRLVRVNTLTAEIAELPLFDGTTLGIINPVANAIAISPAAPDIAVITGTDIDAGVHPYLWKVDIDTGTVLGAAVPTSEWIIELAYNLDGSVLYGVNIDGELVTVNSNTGTTTLIGDPGLSSFIEGLAFRPGDGELFAIDGSGQDRLVRLDPADGSLLQVIGNLGVVGPNGLAFVPGYQLSITKSGSGSGLITSNPVGINCGSTCSYDFNATTEVTLTATAAAGSSFTGWSGGVCTGTGTCTVTMTAAISVTADFTESSIFSDVPVNYWARGFIERLYQAGITDGCATNPLRYCPETTVTRAPMAVFLLRGIHGSGYSPPAVGTSTGFGDVPTTYWAAAWIKQLAAEGITGGCGSGSYCPEAPVTRAQMAVFLLRSKHGASYNPPGVGAGTGFTDVPSTFWAAAWIKQLVAEGITSGCGTNLYCPEAPVTRAQMAVFLVRTFNLP